MTEDVIAKGFVIVKTIFRRGSSSVSSMSLSNRRPMILATLAALLVSSMPASAEPFPAQHYGLAPVGDEPLRSGFVEVIHPEGPNIYARHVYQLNGARSDETYEVWVHVWTADLDCAGQTPYHLPVALLATNRAGDGHADVVHTPEDLAALGLGHQPIGGEVSIELDGTVAYTTGCRVLQLD